MKNATGYPYPVINDEPFEDGDYLETAFQCGLKSLKANEDNGSNVLSIDYTFMSQTKKFKNWLPMGTPPMRYMSIALTHLCGKCT